MTPSRRSGRTPRTSRPRPAARPAPRAPHSRSAGPAGAIRYAVVGLGNIAQTAVLPAFGHARRNSVLAALVSDDPGKLETLGRRYRVPNLYGYDRYAECLESGAIDAVYIALPNHLHRDYAVRAAEAGIHVLCEKPMAVTVAECEDMIRAADEHGIRLMVAYRLHFERANLEAMEIARSGRLGALRLFASAFSMQVREGDIRLRRPGGGTLYDIGVYCINAARALFQAEPMEVFAFSANGGEERFREVDESTGAVLSFPGARIATFATSFGAADAAWFELVGARGRLRLENAYEYAGTMRRTVTAGGRTSERTYPPRDQFAPELMYFSQCVLEGRAPEPSGIEGMIDVEIVEALYRSAETGKPVPYEGPEKRRRPSADQEFEVRPVAPPEPVRAPSPSRNG